MDKLCDYLFLVYVASIIVMSFIVKVIFVPRFGNSNVVVYLLMCSSIGSLTVVFCKAVALGIKESINGKLSVYSHFMFWLVLAASIFCIIVQMNYLNKSLDIFNTSVVTPVYYVMFTVLVIIASGILFREWHYMSTEDVVGCSCGFLVVTTAVFMLNIFKDMPISFRELNMNARVRWTNNIEDLQSNNYTLNG